MGQIKIFGLESTIEKYRIEISDIIHSCVVNEFKFPADKRFHRFFPMSRENFILPDSKSKNYTIIEISMFEGRTVETKKNLIKSLFREFKEKLGFEYGDIEITIFETPKCNWGFKGSTGDEVELNYKVEV